MFTLRSNVVAQKKKLFILMLSLLVLVCTGCLDESTNPVAPGYTISADAGYGSAIIRWDTVAGATSYYLYYRAGTIVDKIYGTKVPYVVSPYMVTGLANGTVYSFAVTSVVSGVESMLSSSVTVMTY